MQDGDATRPNIPVSLQIATEQIKKEKAWREGFSIGFVCGCGFTLVLGLMIAMAWAFGDMALNTPPPPIP